MRNADLPAMPCQPLGQDGMPSHEMTYGLTKREMFAMAAMQGLLAYGDLYLFSSKDRAKLAKDAVDFAEAVLAELERRKPKC